MHKDKTLKTIVKGIVSLSVLLIIVACEKVPNYSKVPEISYNSYSIKRNVFNPDNAVFGDSLTLNINYKDGDGDLGLANDELGPSNPKNYIIDLQIKKNGTFTTILLDPRLDGQFPKLSTDNIVGPIEGVLSNRLFIPRSSPFSPNDSIRYDIKIVDRAGNVSNTITTPPIIVFK